MVMSNSSGAPVRFKTGGFTAARPPPSTWESRRGAALPSADPEPTPPQLRAGFSPPALALALTAHRPQGPHCCGSAGPGGAPAGPHALVWSLRGAPSGVARMDSDSAASPHLCSSEDAPRPEPCPEFHKRFGAVGALRGPVTPRESQGTWPPCMCVDRPLEISPPTASFHNTRGGKQTSGADEHGGHHKVTGNGLRVASAQPSGGAPTWEDISTLPLAPSAFRLGISVPLVWPDPPGVDR